MCSVKTTFDNVIIVIGTNKTQANSNHNFGSQKKNIHEKG